MFFMKNGGFFFNSGVLFSISELNTFHSFGCSLFLSVLMFVFFSLVYLISINYSQKLQLSYKSAEFFCCLFPVLILLLQMVPSLLLLWKMCVQISESILTIKVVGHQWYWTYEVGDSIGMEFDSYLKGTETLELGDFRYLEVDNRLVLPCQVNVRFVLTSSDVIHSWALPSYFLKLDAMPGLLTVFSYKFPLVGVYYGQCSEICGANHAFMPIVVEITHFELFKTWLMSL